jgi:hypothetical protein
MAGCGCKKKGITNTNQQIKQSQPTITIKEVKQPNQELNQTQQQQVNAILDRIKQLNSNK